MSKLFIAVAVRLLLTQLPFFDLIMKKSACKQHRRIKAFTLVYLVAHSNLLALLFAIHVLKVNLLFFISSMSRCLTKLMASLISNSSWSSTSTSWEASWTYAFAWATSSRSFGSSRQNSLIAAFLRHSLLHASSVVGIVRLFLNYPSSVLSEVIICKPQTVIHLALMIWSRRV